MKELQRGQALTLVVSSRATSTDLDKLSRHSDMHIRAVVATRAATSEKTLSRLAEDYECYVREGVASNPNTPLSVLRILAQDFSHIVVRQLLYNPNLPQDVRFLILLEHPEWVNDNK